MTLGLRMTLLEHQWHDPWKKAVVNWTSLKLQSSALQKALSRE